MIAILLSNRTDCSPASRAEVVTMTINMTTTANQISQTNGHHGEGEDLDIVVVGAGLTGLFLTHLLLEVYKIDPSRIVLLERQPKRYDLPRAAGFSDDNARLYRTCMPKEAVDNAVQKIIRPVSGLFSGCVAAHTIYLC